MWKTTTAHSTSDLSPKHHTSEISLITSDLMLKHQKWQHWQWPCFRIAFEDLSIGVDTTFQGVELFVPISHVVHIGCFCCRAIEKLFLLLLIRSLFVNKDCSLENLRNELSRGESQARCFGLATYNVR